MVARRATALLAGAALLCFTRIVASGQTCPAADRRLVVQAGAACLVLCDRSRVVASFPVHLGRGGLGKTRQGDDKVPLGLYPLGKPRPSNKFGMFIPIGYPTPAQRRQGYTGQDVGVHGPHRALRWLGRFTNTVSSTRGCIGLGEDRQIEQVSAWVTSSGVRLIEIRR
jgi:hypothetical protein